MCSHAVLNHYLLLANHSLPPRKKTLTVRIVNMARRMVIQRTTGRTTISALLRKVDLRANASVVTLAWAEDDEDTVSIHMV